MQKTCSRRCGTTGREFEIDTFEQRKNINSDIAEGIFQPLYEAPTLLQPPKETYKGMVREENNRYDNVEKVKYVIDSKKITYEILSIHF